jgi:N-carbamoyl-L-amino-acid hydrolase
MAETTSIFNVNGKRLLEELRELAQITDCEQDPSRPEDVAVTRVVFSENDRRARTWLKQKAVAAGLAVREDAVGNIYLRLEGSDSSLAPVGTGSHTDAIPHAGMYDGTVGVLGGLEALRAIAASGRKPKRSIEAVMFTSEEPTRFGIGCLGSRLMSGELGAEKAGALRDKEDISLDELRAACGLSGSLQSVRLQPGHYSAWLELHIEQGPLLEREGLEIGIVTSIAAPASYEFIVEGYGGHAGALLMPDRRDALCAASEVILSLERNVLATGSVDTVGTIGICAVHPGAINSVPSRVLLGADVRDTDPARREGVMQRLRTEINAICHHRKVRITERLLNADEPATCDQSLVELIEGICNAGGIHSRRMVSRAYHDTLFMARLAPVVMIFIPCRNGVSHRPDEYAKPEDIVRGTALLAAALALLAD